jgi:hypothetical protein
MVCLRLAAKINIRFVHAPIVLPAEADRLAGLGSPLERIDSLQYTSFDNRSRLRCLERNYYVSRCGAAVV